MFKKKQVPDYGFSLTTADLKYQKKSHASFDATFLAQLRDTAPYFRTGKGNIVTGESALQTLAVIEALYKSAKSHKEERVQSV